MSVDFTKFLLQVTEAKASEELEVIQSLWSGYGKISRYQLHDSKHRTVIVKYINPDSSAVHPRGWNTNISHQRKVKSYQIETHWYEQWSQDCNSSCPIPALIGTFRQDEKQWIILEDLNSKYPQRKYELQSEQVKVCLRWLAHFHGSFLGRTPTGLWEVGTYWHLETRPDEFAKIEHTELKAKAHIIDKKLNACTYMTILHGDAKLANFCFSQDSKEVAAVDFQYVGGGCGMKDVAYFLGSCLSGPECEKQEQILLAYYFEQLNKSRDFKEIQIDFEDLEAEWRSMYPLACADFNRFLLGWMPSHQKLNRYNLNIMQQVLSKL